METTEEQNIQNALTKQKLIYALALKKVKEEFENEYDQSNYSKVWYYCDIMEILNKHFGNIGDTHYIYDCNKEVGV